MWRVHDFGEQFKEIYEVNHQLGSGSTCVVYEVRDKRDNTNYAAKVFDQLHNEESVKRFNDEIKILEMIKCHPNIIKLIDRYEDQNLRILIFEKVDKEDLFEKIVTKKGYGETQAVPLVRQLISAVSYLHSLNIIHRDIKPENILIHTLHGTENIKLADFGYAYKLTTDEEQLSRLVGTWEYFSPEQISGSTYSKGVDMWALGITIFGIITASSIFYDLDPYVSANMVLAGDLHHLESLTVVSDPCKDFIRRLLTVDPERRITAQQACEHPWIAIESEGRVSPLRRGHQELSMSSPSPNRNREGVLSPLKRTPRCQEKLLSSSSPKVVVRKTPNT